MKQRATIGIGLVLLGLVGLWWVLQLMSGPPVPVRIYLGDPRPPGDFSVRLELETPGGPLPVLIDQTLFFDRKNDDVLRMNTFRTLDLGDAMAFWEYYLMTPTGTADQIRTPIASRSEAIPERPGHHRLVLSFEPYGSELVAEYTGHELQQPLSVLLSSGVWRKPRGETVAEVPFRGLKASANTPLFDRTEAAGKAAAFTGRWRVRFDGSDETAVAVFRVGEFTGEAYGTLLTPTGDYGQLAGRADGDLLRLSKFDGAHAFLFHARMQADGTIAGDFWSGNWHHDTWTAVRDARAALPDAFKQTSATGVGIDDLAFRDLDGTPTRVAELLDAGGAPARVLYLFGSWCPNCADAGAEMKRLKEKYGEQLTVVGLAFEQTEDFERSARQVRLYAERHGADWPVLIAGLADKAKASAELPVLDRVRAFPTTIFLNAKNEIVAVHTGFNGPATGEEHRRQQREFEKVIERVVGGP
jgi:thiol-disulfide isomerase/thioredoxin